ncbi:Wadjet anti-phage system protein JetD domain-containing protein [Streptomyces sp. NPDC012950]|uniref:Wadjet anti-phage system protein JetD domain-containing protein n=1 Tax=Streptomyces sp. NPDC012950 TaxID=3364858 RepID=UPI00367CBDF1
MKHRESELLRSLHTEAEKKNWKKDRRTRLGLEEVWAAFRRVPHRNPQGEYEPLVLARHLHALEQSKHIAQFKQRTQDKISLPVGIWIEPTAAPKSPAPPMPAWHPDIYWLADEWETATAKQRAGYTAVNAWLMSAPDLFRVPQRERALEIFGRYGDEDDFLMPEKTLDSLRSGPLFGDPTRLHHVLRTFTTHPPLLTEHFIEEVGDGYYQRIGAGDLLLVVENSATWWSIVNTLPAGHRLGYVAWGLGGTFRASINTLAAKHAVTEIRYFGDLDLSGLRIPHAAAHTARQRGLPAVMPAKRLYTALLHLGLPRKAKEPPAAEQEAPELTDWLPGPLRPKAARLLRQGRRLAQEWVGYRYLSRTDDWHSDVI